MTELSERERKILQSLIDAHIETAEPVGSKALSEIVDMGVSSATIRNVLAALSDHGLIEQPHTSAGRVPTDRGLRYYVDSLLHLQPPSTQEQGEIALRIGEAQSVEGALKEASRVLSRLVRQTTLVIAARPESGLVRHVDLLRLRDDAVLFIVVTDEGKVHNRLLQWRHEPGDSALLPRVSPPAEMLREQAQRLTALIGGGTVEQGLLLVRARLKSAAQELDVLESKLLALSQAGLAPNDALGVHVDGTSHLLDAATDGDAVRHKRELLALLDEESQIETLLNHAVTAPGVRIFIGDENPSALVDQGVVAAPIGKAGVFGVLGVIGPKNLPYARVVPLVDLTAQVVARALSTAER